MRNNIEFSPDVAVQTLTCTDKTDDTDCFYPEASVFTIQISGILYHITVGTFEHEVKADGLPYMHASGRFRPFKSRVADDIPGRCQKYPIKKILPGELFCFIGNQIAFRTKRSTSL